MTKHYLYILSLLPLQVLAQANKASSCLDCVTIPIHSFSKGMTFYYPQEAPSANSGSISGYYQLIHVDTFIIKKEISYDFLAGKNFEILDILDSTSTDVNQVKHTLRIFKMKKKEALDTVFFQLPPDAVQLSQDEFKAKNRQTFSINGAIFLAGLDTATKLKNRTAYTLFPQDGRKFTKVVFTDVKLGIWETPVRLYYKYQDDSGKYKNATKDVVVCGTNCLSTFSQAFNINLLFICVDPLEGTGIPDSFWTAIREGKVKLGMRNSWVELSLGKPSSVKTSETSESKKTEYLYKNGYHLYFENDILVKVEQ